MGVYPLAVARWLGVPYLHSIGYSIGVALFIAGTRFVPVGLRPLPWLGLVSYPIYLFHPVVFNTLGYVLQLLPPGSWWKSWHLGAYVGLVLLLTIALSALIYRLVERPSIMLGRRLAARWFGESAGAVVPAVAGAT